MNEITEKISVIKKKLDNLVDDAKAMNKNRLDYSLCTSEERIELNRLSHKVMEALLIQWSDPEMFESICNSYNDYKGGLQIKYGTGE